jgi:hypothetical protein
MPAERQAGMDHPHYPWSPLPVRPALRWPDGARLAIGVIVVLEHVEWQPQEGTYQSPTVGMPDFPSIAQSSLREYGHRVGIFRLLDLLEGHRLKPTVAMDQTTAEHYPFLAEHITKRGHEVIAHGVARTQMVTSNMTKAKEREYIRASIASVECATGHRPAGWFGPDYGESERTPQLLAAEGITYVCDWPNDEQPYRMTTPSGELYSLPPSYDLDDHVALMERGLPIGAYADLLRYAADQLHEDGAQSGRLMLPVLRPWLIGQPFRASHLDEALGHVMGMPGVWAAYGSEIISWYRDHSASA